MLKSGVWVLGSKVTSQAIQFLLFFVAARSLEATEFGLYAVLSAVVTLLTIVAEAGWAEQLLRFGYSSSLFARVTSLSVWTAAALTGVCALVSAGLYEQEQTTASALLAIWSFSILPTTLSTSYEAAFTAQGRLRCQAMIRVFAEIVGLCSTIFLFANGIGIFSLPLGRVLSQTAAVFVAAYFLREAPSVGANFGDAVDMMAFSKHIVANRLIIFAASYCSTFFIVGYQSVADAAYYRAAERLVAAISEALGEPIRAMSWLSFRKAAAHGQERLRGATLNGVAAAFAVAAPIFVLLMLYADETVDVLLGEKWHASGAIVSILCIRQLLLLPGYFNEPLLSVTGMIGKRFRVTLGNVAVLIAVAFLAAPFGPFVLAIAQCGVAGYSLLTTASLQTSSGGIAWKLIVKRLACTVLPGTVAMLLTFRLLRGLTAGMSELAGLFVGAGTTAVLYGIVLLTAQLWMMERSRRAAAGVR